MEREGEFDGPLILEATEQEGNQGVRPKPLNLLRKLANGWDATSPAGRYRKKRFDLLVRIAGQIDPPVKILDVGGVEKFWLAMDMSALPCCHITFFNIAKVESRFPNSITLRGDARDMSCFKDKEFDLVVSNSTIEHVGGLREQKRMASEVVRVGKHFFVQTPNRHFPFEPHFLLPWFQYLPTSFRAYLHSRFNMGWWKRSSSYMEALEEVESIRLLTKRELRYLFPNATISTERMWIFAKSFVVYSPIVIPTEPPDVSWATSRVGK